MQSMDPQGIRNDRGAWIALLLLAMLILASIASSQSGLINGHQVIVGSENYCAATLTAGNYACDLLEIITTYTAGATYRFLANAANTGAVTLQLNGIATPPPLVKFVGGVNQALVANDIRAGALVTVTYDGTSMQVQSVLGNAAPALADGDKGDISVTGSGATWTIDAQAVTFAKIANMATDRLVGRDTAASGSPEELTVTGGLEFTTTGGIQRSALTNDVTAAAGSGTTTLATKFKTQITSTLIDAPVTGDTNKVQWYFPSAITITRVVCSISGTTSITIQLDERAEATPNTAGTNVMTAALVCDVDSQVTTTFTNATIAARVPLNLQLTAAVGTPTSLRVHVEYTID